MFASITRSLAIAGLSLAIVLVQPANAQELEYKSAHVVTNVFPEDSIVRIADEVATNRLLRTANGSDGRNRKYGEAFVSAEDIQHFLNAIGDKRQIRGATLLRTTLITGNTDPHIDSKVNGDGFKEDEEVMFVFLDNNERAFFQIGEDKIPARKGTMVKFDGNRILHNTVVPSGTEVRLLGPIDSRDLDAVGTPGPSPGPTTGPTTKWQGLSSKINYLIGILLGYKEDDLLDPAAQSEILAQLSTGPLADWVSPNDMEGIPTAVMSSIVGCGVDLDDLTSGGMPSEDALGCLRQAFGLPMAGEGLEGIEDIAGMSMSMP